MRGLLIFAATAVVTIGQACCGTSSTGVRFLGQKNLIIWDDRNGIEHFVRDAQFSTKSKDLGFIAPTPSRPELGEARAVFHILEALAPRGGRTASGASGGGFGGLGGGVQVIEEKVVGGYQAAVLKSTDGSDLVDWLRANEYPVSSTIKTWFDFYIRKGWYFTAFKVSKKKEGETVATGPVRLSFKTDRPYNPYLVPSDNIPTQYEFRDRLNLYFIGRGRFAGKVGNEKWAGVEQWSVKLRPEDVTYITEDLTLPHDAIPPGSKVTKFVDEMFPRKAVDDIFFTQLFP